MPGNGDFIIYTTAAIMISTSTTTSAAPIINFAFFAMYIPPFLF